MKIQSKILFNTLTLYAKMIVTTIIALYFTRVVLKTLGADDFGLYSLIGGVIALLSFLNSALMTSTQRFLSVSKGEKNINKEIDIFNSSIIIHLVLSLLLVFILEIASLFLFDGFLNINSERVDAAKIVYQLMILSTVVTIIGVPYNAAINANEDLWFFALIETICAVLKIFIIVLFHISSYDALITYTAWITFISILNLFIKYVWCIRKYSECKHFKMNKSSDSIKKMLAFTGWNAFGGLALIGRNQGVAILLNIFLGTAINAVYGIANQLNSQLIYFSTMMTTSMTPQIMKSHGEGNNERMLRLSFFTSKMAFFLSAVFAIPLLIEIDFILKIWLGTVPEYTREFCMVMLLMFLVMQLYPGITRAIQACGKIKSYEIITVVNLLMPLPVGYIMLYNCYPGYTVIYLMVFAQISQMVCAIILAKKLVGLNRLSFVTYVFKAIIIFTSSFIGGYLIKNILICPNLYRFIIILIVSMSLFTFAYFIIVFDKKEKNKILETIKQFKKRV